MATIGLRVLLFSVLRQRIGATQLDVRLEEQATGGDLLDHLAERYPVLARYRSITRLSVNEEYVHEEVSLADGDVVALITPVSGG